MDHKYLVRGHTFLENDTDFSKIEKRKKSADVNVPRDWSKIVKEANLKSPFIVREMEQEDLSDWKTYLEKKYKMAAKDQNGDPMRFRSVHWMNFGWAQEEDESTGELKMVHHPDEVWLRDSFSRTEPWKKVKLRVTEPPAAAQPARLYERKLKLNPAKVKDLQTTAAKYIPEPQRQFYLDLESIEEQNEE